MTSTGVELGVLWKPTPWFNWYNSASYSKTTYDDDLNWCTTTCVVKATAGKQQVDTPKEMLSSVVTLNWRGFSGSLMGKYTGERFYTYTNDQGFGGYTTFDLGLSYDLSEVGGDGGEVRGERDQSDRQRYASNFDGSVFAPDDATGSIVVFHASAPRQVFATLSYAF